MAVVFPELVGEMAKHGVKRVSIAKELGLSTRALYSKLVGDTDFTLSEADKIHALFFPDTNKDKLFSRIDPPPRA